MFYLWANSRHPRTNRLLHAQQHTTHNKKQNTLSPWSPQAAGFQWLQFYRWVQSPYVARLITIIATWQHTFFWWHLLFLYLFYYYSMCSGSVRSLTKGEFLKIYLVLFLCRCIETMRTNPIYPALPYFSISPKYSSCFCLILDRGGGGRHCHNVIRKVEVGSVVVSVAFLLRKKILRNKRKTLQSHHPKSRRWLLWCKSF